MEYSLWLQRSLSNCLSTLNGPSLVSSNWWHLQTHTATRNFSFCSLQGTVRVLEWLGVARTRDMMHLQDCVTTCKVHFPGQVSTHRGLQWRRLFQEHYWNWHLSDSEKGHKDRYRLKLWWIDCYIANAGLVVQACGVTFSVMKRPLDSFEKAIPLKFMVFQTSGKCVWRLTYNNVL